MMTAICQSCRYSIVENRTPLCRRYPPQVQEVPGYRTGASFYPRVNLDDWCGEHQPKPADQSP